MPRFVILLHIGSPNYKAGEHWDLMLEAGDVLRSWALAAPPSPRTLIAAAQLPDHRLAYLDYEGRISGDRGVVSRWDRGDYELLAESADELQLLLNGGQTRGRATLRRLSEIGWTFAFASSNPAE
jgi:hypothetical protein